MADVVSSIAGASKNVAGAVTAVVAPSIAVIKWTRSKFDEKIVELEGYITQLDDHRSTINGYIDELNAYWTDEDGQKYVATLRELIDKINQTKERVNRLKASYSESAEELTAAKVFTSEVIDKAKSTIDSFSYDD